VRLVLGVGGARGGPALGAVSLGPLLLLPVAGLAWLLSSRPHIRRSAFGALSGAGLVLLYVAYVQRHGPGTRCWQTATAAGCDQHLDPRPWLVLGLVALVGGVVGHAVRKR
jgi:hypothetical protein